METAALDLCRGDLKVEDDLAVGISAGATDQSAWASSQHGG